MLVDLRGNQGGSLIDARRCADFFMEKGGVLFRLRMGRDGERVVKAEEPMVAANPVVLLQDEATASAAEAFILALHANHRAMTAGTTSYGKGLAQRFLPLDDGAALRLTYAEILAADGSDYHGRGLVPDRPLPETLLNADYSQPSNMEKLLVFLHLSSS